MSAALDKFCGSSFWDVQQVWNTTDPDFPQCFQKTVLVWIPCGFLWLFMPLEVFLLIKTNQGRVPWSLMSYLKAFLMTILIGLQMYSFVTVVIQRQNGDQIASVDLFTPIIKLAAFLLVSLLMFLALKKGRHTSFIIFFFWLFFTITSAFTYRSLIHKAFMMGKIENLNEFIIFAIYFPSVVGQLILSSFSDPSPYMKLKQQNENTSPEDIASFLSSITYSWFDRMVYRGYKQPLTANDLWSLSHKNRSDYISQHFEIQWDKEAKKVRRSSDQNHYQSLTNDNQPISNHISITKMLWKSFGWTFTVGTAYKMIGDLLGFVSPLILELLIKFISSNDPIWKGYFYGVLLFIAAIVQSFFINKHYYVVQCMSVRMHSAVVTAIFKKSLYISNAAKKSSTVGEIVNLMSVDAQRLTDLLPELSNLFTSPVQIVLALYMLWNVLGISVLSGLSVMLFIIPANILLAGKSEKYELVSMGKKDERMKVMNEVLTGMKVLKLYAWELPFYEQINKIRKVEITLLKKVAWLNSFMWFLFNYSPFMISLLTFTTYIFTGHELNATVVFVSLSLFNILKEPLSYAPTLIALMVQIRVSVQRLNRFMNYDELDMTQITHDESQDDAVVISNGTFAWDADADPVLHNINLSVPQGKLVAIVGTVGVGKSSLISAILGEMEKCSGTINTKGTFAYVAQQAWIQNATLKDNILFGKELDDSQYKKVLEACALMPDLDVLPGRDMTEIGEKGINLSGGQKQRVSVARAVYADADVYLLDDPLSAVDSHVGKHIFDEVIGPTGLLKSKTRLLVTHSLTFLPEVDIIFVLDNGKISETGSYKELLEQNGAFSEFINNFQLQGEETELNEEQKGSSTGLHDTLSAGSGDESRRFLLQKQISLVSVLSSEDERAAEGIIKRWSPPSRQNSITTPVNAATLITVELAETGRVGWPVYKYYIVSIGIFMFVLNIVLFSLSWIANIGSNFWLSVWSNDDPHDTKLRDVRLAVYGTLGFLQSVFLFLGYIVFSLALLRAAVFLHQTMLFNILRSPMTFFDTTPIGRIVNRFSHDVDTVDSTIPNIIMFLLELVLQLIGTLIVICISTPMVGITLLPLAVIYYFVQKMYISTSRQLKRLESISRSPIYSHFSETVSGLSTIRAYRKQDSFVTESQNKVDENHKSLFMTCAARRWLSFRLDVVGNIVILGAAISAVMEKGSIEPGTLGLSVSYAMTLTFVMNWTAKMFSELETYIVAVERIKEYTVTPNEAEWVIEANRPQSGWPERGTVVFNNYSTKYRQGLDLVLRNISCRITEGEKIGIVGRTGAGKSSLTLALFRIIEPVDGTIVIDDLDITSIGLHDLRSRLTIIPQDPVLFCGTLRMNLDPFDEYTDEAIWKALEHSHLKQFVSTLPEGITYEIAEGGENLSVGQRQLVCLARALLRKTKVLILDEATAAIDLETDELIQTTIREEFADCTILTIAHRLNTILDSTRVMVLKSGVVEEFDSPALLLENKESIFYSMAKDAGIV